MAYCSGETTNSADSRRKRRFELALEAGRSNIGIAYTYSEPSVWYEYVFDTARLIKDQGLKNVMVTNGFIRTEPLENPIAVYRRLQH